MKVAILTMFCGLSSTYSLVNVVADQIRMLLRCGISVKVLVSETCPNSERKDIFLHPSVEWVKIVNTRRGIPFTWHDYSSGTGRVHSTFFEEADAIAKDLIKNLADTDVCILHDILYQGWHLVHNIAIRQARKELPRLRFLAFTHSLPASRPAKLEYPFSARFTDMPDTRFIYPTQSGIPALARQYDVPEEKCAVVSNTIPLLQTMSQAVQQLADSVDLMTPEILVVYPARLTPGKRPDKVAALAGSIKSSAGKTIRVIFCDFPSADILSGLYKQMIRTEGKKFGLCEDDLVFTSDLGFPEGFPRQAVFELFQLSNLFICPSYSESFGLTVLEAGSRGNFLVLNEAVPALKELGEQLGAYLMRWDARNFGYDTHEKYHPSEKVYYEEHGSLIARLMQEDHSLNVKTVIRNSYNPQRICQKQLLPLLNESRTEE